MSASVGGGRRWNTGRAVGRGARVHAVEEQRVKVNIEIRGSTKSLDGRNAAAATPHQASPRRPPSLPAEDGAQEDAQHRARQGRVEGELVAHRHRHGKDPLADGHARQDAIDEVRGELAHAPPAARRTEPAATAAEGHHRRVPAALTLHAQQTVLEPATLEVRLELAPNERRPPTRPVRPARPRQEGREVGRDGPVEHRLLGLAALVGRGRGTRPSHANGREHASCPGATALQNVVATRTSRSRSQSSRARHRPRIDTP